MSDDWPATAASALGIDGDLYIDEILDLAREVAHGVERKAAPVATFLAGFAAGRDGGDPDAVRRAIETVRGAIGEP
jgi:uncharacterized protein DUF6457